MSLSNSLLCRILVVFLLFCLSKASGGTCLSYGHSCWGGHGKRSGNAHIIGPFSQKHISGWYISKLLDFPVGDSKNIYELFKNQNLDTEEADNFNRSDYQLYSELDTEKHNVRPEKGNSEDSVQKKWNSEADEPEEEIIVLTPRVQREPISKFRLYQIMNKENNKPRKQF